MRWERKGGMEEEGRREKEAGREGRTDGTERGFEAGRAEEVVEEEG